MTVSAPPDHPSPTVTTEQDRFEALIEEARQRARRRRRIYGAVAVGIAAVVPATMVINDSDSAHSEPSALDNPLAAAATAPTGELVASMLTREVLAHRNLWLYLYADGRLISAGGGNEGWLERRLTAEAVAQLQDEIIASGLFDPDRPPPGSQGPAGANIQARIGDRQVNVIRADGQTWTPEFDRLAGRLVTLESWLPATAWVQREATSYVPTRYAVCAPSALARADLLSQLPAARSRSTRDGERPAVGPDPASDRPGRTPTPRRRRRLCRPGTRTSTATGRIARPSRRPRVEPPRPLSPRRRAWRRDDRAALRLDPAAWSAGVCLLRVSASSPVQAPAQHSARPAPAPGDGIPQRGHRPLVPRTPWQAPRQPHEGPKTYQQRIRWRAVPANRPPRRRGIEHPIGHRSPTAGKSVMLDLEDVAMRSLDAHGVSPDRAPHSEVCPTARDGRRATCPRVLGGQILPGDSGGWGQATEGDRATTETVRGATALAAGPRSPPSTAMTVGVADNGSVTLTDAAGNDPAVVTTDVQARNGVIHVIYAVLLPA